jgi:hypothetical protein
MSKPCNIYSPKKFWDKLVKTFPVLEGVNCHDFEIFWGVPNLLIVFINGEDSSKLFNQEELKSFVKTIIDGRVSSEVSIYFEVGRLPTIQTTQFIPINSNPNDDTPQGRSE